jgi:hypothetical protein
MLQRDQAKWGDENELQDDQKGRNNQLGTFRDPLER